MDDRAVIESFLTTRFRAKVRRDHLAFDEPLISSGIIDSFGVLEVMTFLEDTFNVVLDPADHELSQFETIDGIAALVHSAPKRR
jgi:acyl carrier protein